jgi:hypothetical protein
VHFSIRNVVSTGRILPALLVLLFMAAPARAAIEQYSLSVKITGSGLVANSFAGQTYTGTFDADTTTGAVTDFTADLLNGSFSVASLPAGTAAFDGLGDVKSLTFGGSVLGSDAASHNFGFTEGFNAGQISTLGVDPNNYFAYLNGAAIFQGGGTPTFQDLGPVTSGGGGSAVPLPAAFWPGLITAAGMACFAMRRRLA